MKINGKIQHGQRQGILKLREALKIRPQNFNLKKNKEKKHKGQCRKGFYYFIFFFFHLSMSLVDVQQQHALHCTPTQDSCIHVNLFVTQCEKRKERRGFSDSGWWVGRVWNVGPGREDKLVRGMNQSWFLCCGNLPPHFHSFTGSLSHRAKVDFEGMSLCRWVIYLDDIMTRKKKKGFD